MSGTLNDMGVPQDSMTCQQLVELVTDYFEGALTPEERVRFDAHVAVCPGCENYLEQMRTTMRLVASTDELEERPEVAELLELFRDYKRA
jgi:predicted anti-sigma-YlaC factor YlaD